MNLISSISFILSQRFTTLLKLPTMLTTWFEQLTDDTKKTVDVAVKNVNKAVGQGLSQYNTKVQDVANRVPGDFSKKAAEYPWVTMTISLVAGLLLGILLKPGRQHIG